MIIIAFSSFFVLGNTLTQPRIDPPSFLKQQLDLIHDSIALILQACFAFLTFPDQKNRVKVPPDVPFARLFNSNSCITASVITSTLGHGYMLCPALGFLPSDISACCLHATGAMAFLLSQIDTDIIW
ncbi:hypothetical protein ACHAW6_005382 [Cyclotella cf. meneghiniana]